MDSHSFSPYRTMKLDRDPLKVQELYNELDRAAPSNGSRKEPIRMTRAQVDLVIELLQKWPISSGS